MKRSIDELVPAEERLTGYLVDLEGFSLDDNISWIQAFPVGEYKHPVYGKISMTHERALRMAANARNKVIGTEIPIDFAHRKDTTKGQGAAGWVKVAEGRADGLWLQVEWTKEAAGEIKEKKWRYFSPEFVDAFEDRETGVKTQDVLLGGGLTNRPFLRNILPVNLSEVIGDSSSEKEEDEHRKGGERVEKFLENLRKALGLEETVAEDAILEVVVEAVKAKTLAEEAEVKAKAEADEKKKKEEATKLSDELLTDPGVKALVERLEAADARTETYEKRLAASEVALKLADVDSKLENWNKGDKVAIPVALNDDIKSIMLNGPSEVVQKLESVLDTIVTKGLVELTEKGRSRTVDTDDSAIDKAEKGIKKLMADAKAEDRELGYADAASEYFRDVEPDYGSYIQEASLDGEVKS